MRVVGDEGVASTRHRVLAHLESLRAEGFQTEIHPEWKRFRPPLHKAVRLVEMVWQGWQPVHADVLFVHRRTYPGFFARRIRRAGIPLIFDFDDALYLPPPGISQDERTTARFRSRFLATVAAADLVLCGNRELASEVPHSRTEILPTPIDCELFRPDALKPATGPVVGWVGHGDNLPYLERLAEPLREVARRHPGFRLIVVADREPEIRGLNIEYRRWSLASQLRCFEDMTIGLMPLEDTPWARGKCAFKLLQYMALGLPIVASPVGMNTEVVVSRRNGFLARSDEEWIQAIGALLSNSELAREFAVAGRKTAESRYSLKVLSSRLIRILEDQLSRARRRRPEKSR